MSGHIVTITFAVAGEERHAAKLAGKLEAVVCASKRVAVNSDGAKHSTVIEATR